MVAGSAVRGVGPLCDLGEAIAAWCLETLLARLLLVIPALYLCLVRLTHRFPVQVYVGAHPLMQAVVKRCPSFQRDYRPPTWACGAWAQAVLYLYRSWRNNHLRGFVREVIRLPDGEQVSLFWMAPPGRMREAMVAAAGGDGVVELYASREDTGGRRGCLGSAVKKAVSVPVAGGLSPAESTAATAPAATAAGKGTEIGSTAKSATEGKPLQPPHHHHQPMSHGHGHGSQPPPDAASAAAAAAADPVIESLARSLPEDGETPIVVVCHGVFQNAADLYELCQFLTETCGYVVCVFNRRGNDLPLSRAKFNTVGDQEDFRFILSRLRHWFPYHSFYGVGISAGSSLLARYLGDASDESELDGGVLISGGYDMEQSLQHMTPLADLVVTSHAKSHFLQRNEETLAAEDQGSLQRLKRSRSMHEFHQHMHVFDGKASREEYFQAHNPALVLDKIARPTVYINAYDDMCFPGHFTFQYKHLVERCSLAAILHLERGGHGTFYEDWDAGTSRAFQIVREFVDCLQRDEDGLVATAETTAVLRASASTPVLFAAAPSNDPMTPVLPSTTHYSPADQKRDALQALLHGKQEEEQSAGGVGVLLAEGEDDETTVWN